MSADQTPLDCKDANDSGWMLNDQRQSPCQVLSSSIRRFDSGFNLTWLDLQFHCPHSGSSNSTTSTTLDDFCCSSVAFSLFSACWSCQWDRSVDGVVQTTWGDFASNCSLHSTGNGQQSRGTIGTLSTSVQSSLAAANIHIPPWAFLSVSDNSTWNQSAAQLNATSSASSSSSRSNKLSTGCLVGITLGSFALFCVAIFIVTIICMRKQQRLRMKSYQKRFSLFRPKKRVVNIAEKGTDRSRTPATGANRLLDTSGRVNLAMDDELASPESAKGYKAPRRNNSDNDIDITHEAMLPTLPTSHEAPDRPGSAGIAARLASNVRRSLGRVGSGPLISKLGRSSHPTTVVPFNMPGYSGSNNRYTHPMTQQPSHHQPFSVPLSADQMADPVSRTRPTLDHINSAPPSAWPGYNSSNPPQQYHQPPNSAPLLSNEEPTPLTAEALAAARVAQDGSLFVPENIARWRQTATGIPAKEEPPRPKHERLKNENELLVRTISIERARVSRDADPIPHRSDSLDKRPLVLHEPPTEGALKKKSQLKHKAKDPLERGDSAGAGYSGVASRNVSRPSAPLLSPLEAPQPSSSSRPFAVPLPSPSNLPAPVARKAVPKSDFSGKATAGSGKEEDDVSIATKEILNITSSPLSQERNAKLRGKKLSSEDAVRESLLAHTSYTGGNIKSEGSRTPSPKVAPSAEWFDLFRRGTVPPSFTPGGSAGTPNLTVGAGGSSKDLARNNTAPATGPSKRRGENSPSSSTPQRFQLNPSAVSPFPPTPGLAPGTAFYGAPIAATYTTPPSTSQGTSANTSAQPSTAPAAAPPTRTLSDTKPVSLTHGVTLNRTVPAPLGARPIRQLPRIPPGGPRTSED